MDYRLGDTLFFNFTTTRFDTGAAVDADSTPTATAYENGGTAITAGVTVTNVTTGVYQVEIVASGANGYEAGKAYTLVIAATVNSVAAKGAVGTPFVIRARNLDDLAFPATSGRSITVEADGMAHADLKEWLGTAPLALSAQRVQVLVGAITAGVIEAATFASAALDAVWSTATRLLTAGTNIALAKGTGVTGFNDLSAAQVNTEADTALSDAGVAAIKAKTDSLTFTTALQVDARVASIATGAVTADAIATDAIGSLELAAGAAEEIADAVWDEALSGHTTAGTAGANQNLVDDIQASTSVLTAASNSIRVPVNLDGSFEVVKGDSYTLAEGTQISFSVGQKPWPTDLTSYVITIVIDGADGTALLTDTLTITTATGSSRAVRWEPTAAETATLTVGTFSYQIRAVKGSETKTLELGKIRVRAGTI